MQATRALLKQVGRYAGVALQNSSFMSATIDYMLVPGKAWSVQELKRAAPLQLKTR